MTGGRRGGLSIAVIDSGRIVFTRVDHVLTLRFRRDSAGAFTGFESEDIGGLRRVPRVGPFVRSLRT
ncbi:MAG: hypothetical protein IT357_17845 [Gemmatimonadaceae bacterium]|nr:hypothetical protein [Gemmatimonadaceae bacterium]